MWDEIIYPFPNFNGETIDIWEEVGDFIPLFSRRVGIIDVVI